MKSPLMSRFALALGLAFLPLIAGEPEPPKAAEPAQAHRAERMEKLAKHLHLSPEQRAAIKGLHDKHKEDLRARHAAVKASRRAFVQALMNPDTPEERIKQLHQALSDKQLDALLARRSLRQEVRKVLTPAQREQAAELHGRAEQRMKERREHMKALLSDK